ncbi:MAG: T9SS type A sorting domain-containing protein, partial [Bacteroidia bacterium]
GGTSFSQLSGNGVGSPRQIWFVDDNTGYLINSEGDVFRTTNGSTFEPAGATCLQTPFDFYCINDSTCFAAGSFTNASCDVSFTTNRGQTWTDLTFPYAYAAWGVHALDTSAIWIVGQNQTIIRRGLGGVITANEEIQQSGAESNELSIYPNPSNGSIQLSTNATFEAWQLIDLSGRILCSGNEATLNIEQYNKGMYLLQVHYSDNRTAVLKVIKE